MAAIPTRDEWKKLRTVPQGAVSGVSMGKAFEAYGKAKNDPESQIAALKKLSEATLKYLTGVKKKFAAQKAHTKMIADLEDIHKSILQLITINKAKVNPRKALRKAVDTAMKSSRALVGKATNLTINTLWSEQLRGVALPFKMLLKSEPNLQPLYDEWEKAATWKVNGIKDNVQAERTLTQIMIDLNDLDTSLQREDI